MVSEMHYFKAQVYCIRNAESSFQTTHTMSPFINILHELCLSNIWIKNTLTTINITI